MTIKKCMTKKIYGNKIVSNITIYFICSADFLLDLKAKKMLKLNMISYIEYNIPKIKLLHL